jgi:tripartite-type tricarboxylate transporter receptor subunit TctC
MKQHLAARLLGMALSTLALSATALQPAHGQAYPSKPLRFIVPLGPGSGSDNVTRLAARLAAAELGQPTFVENKPGADTVLAVQALLASPADGYSVMMLSPSSMVINPIIGENLPYDAQRDLRPLAGMLRSAAVLVTGSGSRFNSFADVAAAARKGPGSISWASYSQHYRLGALALQQTAGLEFNHVPYKSPSQVQTDLIGGAIDVALLDIGGAAPLIASGKLKALAVTSKDRHAKLPAVPTLRESGLADYDLYTWIGLGIASKTPESVAHTLELALLKATSQPEFRAFVTDTAGAEVLLVGGKELAALISTEVTRYRKFAKMLDAVQK